MPNTTATSATRLVAAGDLVVHGDQATLFGPFGTPVSSISRARMPQAPTAAAPDDVPRSSDAVAAPLSGRVSVGESAERPGPDGRRRAGIVAAFAAFDESGSWR